MHPCLEIVHRGVFTLLHAMQAVLELRNFRSKCLFWRSRDGVPPGDVWAPAVLPTTWVIVHQRQLSAPWRKRHHFPCLELHLQDFFSTSVHKALVLTLSAALHVLHGTTHKARCFHQQARQRPWCRPLTKTSGAGGHCAPMQKNHCSPPL